MNTAPTKNIPGAILILAILASPIFMIVAASQVSDSDWEGALTIMAMGTWVFALALLVIWGLLIVLSGGRIPPSLPAPAGELLFLTTWAIVVVTAMVFLYRDIETQNPFRGFKTFRDLYRQTCLGEKNLVPHATSGRSVFVADARTGGRLAGRTPLPEFLVGSRESWSRDSLQPDLTRFLACVGQNEERVAVYRPIEGGSWDPDTPGYQQVWKVILIDLAGVEDPMSQVFRGEMPSTAPEEGVFRGRITGKSPARELFEWLRAVLVD